MKLGQGVQGVSSMPCTASVWKISDSGAARWEPYRIDPALGYSIQRVVSTISLVMLFVVLYVLSLSEDKAETQSVVEMTRYRCYETAELRVYLICALSVYRRTYRS